MDERGNGQDQKEDEANQANHLARNQRHFENRRL
jgi:hypothetical protein